MFITSTGTATNNVFSGEHSTGTYKGNAVLTTIEVIERRGEFELKKVIENTVIKFRLFWDGACISTVASEKEGVALLNDFCPVVKKRGRPRKTA